VLKPKAVAFLKTTTNKNQPSVLKPKAVAFLKTTTNKNQPSVLKPKAVVFLKTTINKKPALRAENERLISRRGRSEFPQRSRMSISKS